MSNGTNNGGNDSVRFAVIASAMTPRGAWAKSQGGMNDEARARAAFNVAGFARPESGIAWGEQLDLVRVITRKVDGVYLTERETLATRRA